MGIFVAGRELTSPAAPAMRLFWLPHVGADVLGIDASDRLVGVARQRAAAEGLSARFVVGDALALPVAHASSDIVLSVFGVIFASDPATAVREIARVLLPGGRAYVTAWVPSGPIDAMLGAFSRAMERATAAPLPEGFPWSESEAVSSIAGPWGLSVSTTRGELEIRAASPEAYVDAGRDHPMAIAASPLLQRAGVVDTLRAEMIEASVPCAGGGRLMSAGIDAERRPRRAAIPSRVPRAAAGGTDQR